MICFSYGPLGAAMLPGVFAVAIHPKEAVGGRTCGQSCRVPVC